VKRIILFLVAFIISAQSVFAQQSIRLNNNWQFIRQDLGGAWESVRDIGKTTAGSTPLWDSVSLPHCVNARDAVDPDVNYYQGPAWYRTLLTVKSPYAKGRTLLHFEGAGQKTEVYIYTTKVGSHVGGYDEWTVDITDAIEAFRKSDTLLKQFKGKVPLSIRTDNSRDLEMIPSNLSDFNVYGGIYRYLNLGYVPEQFTSQIFASAEVDSLGKTGRLKVSARFGNLHHEKGVSGSVRLIGPDGKSAGEKTFSTITNS
jgi:beta-galactosidase